MVFCRTLTLSFAILATASLAAPKAELRGSAVESNKPDDFVGGGSLKQEWHAEPAAKATPTSGGAHHFNNTISANATPAGGAAHQSSNNTTLGAASSCSYAYETAGWSAWGCRTGCFRRWTQYCYSDGGCICATGCGTMWINGYLCYF